MRNNNTYKVIIILLLAVIAVRIVKNFAKPKIEEKDNPKQEQVDENTKAKETKVNDPANNSTTDIAALTSEAKVVPYVKEHHQLPGCYITKREARQNGWNPAEGNLCEVLPGRAIGGDVFTNREANLPTKPGRKWFEADLNYNCEHRNADRLLFSSDGLVFVTKDHYKTFDQR